MKNTKIQTERLELIAATQEFVRAEINDLAVFATLLEAEVPEAWPPEFNDLETMTFTLQKLESKPEQVGWWAWYFLLREAGGGRVLIGFGGFKGQPDAENNVEVGYSILKAFQNKGYGSEATAGLVKWAFEQGVESVTAETLPELVTSIRVLEKNGFTYVGAGSEEGVILYRKERPDAL